MKISNFRLIERSGKSALDWRFKATIDTVTGFFRKHSSTREIQKEYGGFWYFADTGEFVPGSMVEALVRSYEAKQDKELKYCEVTD